MASGSRFIGGPCDGVVRAVPGEPQTLYVPTFSLPVFNPHADPDALVPTVDHVYEKRAGGFYYEHVGTRSG
jgi:hypothetical protein